MIERFQKWFWVPLLFAGVLIFWLCRRRRGPDPLAVAHLEIDAIEAESQAKKLKAVFGAERATEKIKAKYLQKIAELDENQRAKAKELEHDPAKLARYLVKVATLPRTTGNLSPKP